MEADTFSVLMVKQNRIALGGISLEFPAGGIESNESPRQAAKRELEEETGISVCTDKLINLGNEFIICESAFSETASWFAFLLDERQVIRSQNRHLNHENNGEIINLACPFFRIINIKHISNTLWFISLEIIWKKLMTGKTLWYGCQLLGSQINKRTSSDVLDLCLDNNVLHFDLAERYPFPEQKETVGESEKIFGTWVKRKDREKIYIGTKVTGRNSEGWFGEDAERLTYNRIRTAIQSSLKRLKTDYIDIFFLHWPDRFTNNFGRVYYEPEPDPRFITFEEQFSALVNAYEKGEIKQ